MKIFTRIIPFVVSVFFLGCSSSVQMTATYTAPEIKAENTCNNIFISGVFAGDTARKLLEEAVETELQEEGVSSLASHEIWAGTPEDIDLSSEALFKTLDAAEKDAILTVSVLAGDSESRFVQRGVTYEPITMNPWYRTYDGYYNHVGRVVYNPGYYASGKDYFVEINLYDVDSQELIWSAQTNTYITADLITLTENLADLIVDELEEEQLILDNEA